MPHTLPKLLGMVHTLATPGTPRSTGASIADIASHAASEARVLVDNGLTGLIIENMHDTQ